MCDPTIVLAEAIGIAVATGSTVIIAADPAVASCKRGRRDDTIRGRAGESPSTVKWPSTQASSPPIFHSPP